jgi:hypothetical protein
MKNLFAPIAAALAILISGCASERIVLRHAQTNDVPVLATNTAPQVSQVAIVRTELNPIPGGPEILATNFVTVTNFVPVVTTNILRVITPEVAYTNLSMNPVANAAVQVGGAVAPVPWAGAAAGIFGTVFSGILALVNNSRRKAALAAAGEAQSESESWQETAGTLVENIELVRKEALKIPGYTKETDAKIVRALQLAQAAAGVKSRVIQLVEERTDFTHSVA